MSRLGLSLQISDLSSLAVAGGGGGGTPIVISDPGDTTSSSQQTATVVTPGKPGNVEAGVQLVALVGVKGSGADTATITGPSGWTLHKTSSRSGAAAQNTQLQVWSKTAGSSEPANYQWSTGGPSFDLAAELAWLSGGDIRFVDGSGEVTLATSSVVTPPTDIVQFDALVQGYISDDNAPAPITVDSGQILLDEIDKGFVNAAFVAEEITLGGLDQTRDWTFTGAGDINVISTVFRIGSGPGTTVSYAPLIINANEVDADLTNFPVYVDLSTMIPDFWSLVQSDGGDIRVTNADNSRLSVDLVSIDAGAETGQMWFLADNISSTTDTEFRVWFNSPDTLSQPAASAAFGSEAVWTEYAWVDHMENASGVDATGNNTVVSQFGTPSTALDSKIDDAVLYANNEATEWPDSSAFDPAASDFTVQGWMDSDDNTFTKIMISKDGANGGFGASTSEGWWMGRNANGALLLVRLDGTANIVATSTAGAIPDGSYHMLHGVIEGGQVVKMYVNGELADTSTAGAQFNVTSDRTLVVGGREISGAVANDFIGNADEMRITQTARSAAWVAAEYLNQDFPDAFYRTNPLNNAPPQTPVDGIDDVFAWFDASDTTTISDSGGTVTEWRDKTGYGRNLDDAQGTPTTNATTLNGNNVIDFNGTTDQLRGQLPALSRTHTIFVVAKLTTDDVVISEYGSGSKRFGLPAFNDPNWVADGYGVGGTRGLNVDHVPWLLMGRADGDTLSNEFQVNRIQVGTSSAINRFKGLTVGNNPSGANDLDGYVAEIIMYNRALTDSEVTQVYDYLSDKWGVAPYELPVTDGLIAWWDAANEATFSDDSRNPITSGTVTNWNNASPLFSADLIDGGSTGPSTGGTTQNGLNTLQFVRASSEGMQTTPTEIQWVNASDGSWTAFTVAKYTTDGVTQSTVSSDDFSDVRLATQAGRTSGNNASQSGATTDGTYGVGAAIPIAGNTWTIQRVTHDGPNVTLSADVNNGTEESNTSTGTALTDPEIIAIGQYADTPGGNHMDGEIAEIVIYNRALSGTEEDQVRSYLADKWGITIS